MAVTALKIPTNLFHLLFSFGQERLDDKIPNSGRYLSINNKRKILSDRNTQNPGTWERVNILQKNPKCNLLMNSVNYVCMGKIILKIKNHTLEMRGQILKMSTLKKKFHCLLHFKKV